ncbi:MAG: metallophosphoesterase [Clostridia bacterium]|nr:metallophosphoesterase [Clostridia bacterium]
MKVLHCADLHLDSPFRSGSAEKSEVRRRELRGTFSSLVLYVKTEKIPLALLSGDLFDSGFVTRETASFVAKELASAPDCRFVIAPGNHDPYTPDSVYARVDFPENVYIFRDSTLGKFSFPELGTEVYGYAFVKNALETCPFTGKTPDDPATINLLCAHGDVGDPLSAYCPVSEKDIADAGFDYCAFGHVHASEGIKMAGKSYYAYSGCLEGRDFGETGHKGALVLDIEKKDGIVALTAAPVRFSGRRYEWYDLDLSGAADTDEAARRIKSLLTEKALGADTLLRLSLKGSVAPSLRLDVRALTDLFAPSLFYLEIRDETLPLFDTATLENDPTVCGAFFAEMRPLLENGSPEERAEAATALRVGLAALYGEDFTDIG